MAITGLYGALLVLAEVMGTARSADFWRDLVRYCIVRFGSEGGAEMSRNCPAVSSKRSRSALAQTGLFFLLISMGCCGRIAEDLMLMFKYTGSCGEELRGSMYSALIEMFWRAWLMKM